MRYHVAATLACVASIAVAGHAADEPDELIRGRVVVIRNSQVARFVAKPFLGATFDLPDQTNDPTTEGGKLEMFDDDPFRPVSAEFTLAASGWKALGSPAGSTGFKYRGTGSPSDPCRVVVRATVVKAVCKGSGVTLPTPFTGQVGIILTVGTDSKRYCAVFGGDTTKNDETLLRRKNAPPPDVCPLDLNSSTTIPHATSTSTSSSTTTSLSGPVPCCAFPSFNVCAHGPMADCASLGGVPGAAGSLCDSATGACLMVSPSPGPCCDIDREPGDEACSAGPGADAPGQCDSPHSYVPNAICSSDTPSVCMPVPTTSTSTSTTTTASGTVTTTSTSLP